MTELLTRERIKENTKQVLEAKNAAELQQIVGGFIFLSGVWVLLTNLDKWPAVCGGLSAMGIGLYLVKTGRKVQKNLKNHLE